MAKRDWENEDEYSRSFDDWENEGGTVHPQADLPDYRELTKEDLKMWEKDVSNKVKVKNLCKSIRKFLRR